MMSRLSPSERFLGFAVRVFGFLQALCPMLGAKPEISGDAVGRPNILVIVADDLGYGDLGCTGNKKIRTPNLDRMAAEGASFTNFYSPASVCSPSRAAMMTGRLPYRVGIYGFLHAGDPYVHLPPGETTLPQLFREAGYQTALFGKWHVSLNDARAKYRHIPSMGDYGFGYWFSSDNNTKIKDKPGWWRNGKPLGTLDGYAANVTGAEAARWLGQERDSELPFLAFVHFFEPHWFVNAPRELVDGYLGSVTDSENEAYYFAAVENVDREVGRILTVLRDRSLDESTLVFFTSDHGPANLGKGRHRVRNYGTAYPYRGNKYGLWDGSIHVPGLARWSGRIAPQTRWNAPCGAIDWLPTFCELAAIDVPAGLELDGETFAPLLSDPAWKRKKPLEWHHYNATLHHSPNPNAVMRDGNWILCGYYDRHPQGTGRWVPAHMDVIRDTPMVRFTLHNLAEDPRQEKDLAQAYPDRFKRMRDQLKSRHLATQGAALGWEGHRPTPSSP